MEMSHSQRGKPEHYIVIQLQDKVFLPYRSLFPDVFVPEFRIRLHELIHYGDTFCVLGDFDRNAEAPEPSLLAHKGAIFPCNDTWYAVQHNCAAAHGAG
jgi:hypothetical protein